MELIKKAKKLLIVDTVVIVTILLFLLFTKKSLVLYNDQIFQYDIFYETWANMLNRFFTTGEFPFYSFNTYLGSDFYSSMLYYCTGNIFFPLMILFRSNIRIYIIIEYILCIYISSLTMYSFLSNEKIRNDNVLLFACLAYSFSGFALINTGNYMFLRFYAFFPLSLLGVSKIVDKKSTIVFVISVAILFLQNYYLMWPGTILIFSFFIYKILEKKESARNTILLSIKFILMYLIGMLMVSFLLLPGFHYIISNSRIGVSESTSFIFNIETIMLYIADFIVPNVSLMSSTALQSFNPDNYHIYASSATIGLIPLVTAISYIKNNINKTFIFVLFVLGYVFTGVSSVFHGFSNPSFRWIFILIPVILLFSSKEIELNNNLDNNNVFIIYIILFIVSFVIGFLLGYSKNIVFDLIIHAIFIIVNILLYLVYRNNVFVSLKLTNVVYISIFIIIVVSSCFTIPETTRTFDSYTIDMLNDTSEDLMFRIYTPYQIFHYDSKLQLNESMNENYMSTSTYSSVIEPSINTFHSIVGLGNKIIEISDENVLSMLGTKYYILPKNSKFNTNNKELIGYMNGEYPIYESKDYLGFARTYDSLSFINDWKKTSDFNNTLFIDDLNVNIDLYDCLEKKKMIIVEKGENYLKGVIEVKEPNILLIPIPNSKGWKVLDNGKETKTISVNGGFMGVPLLKGENNIEIYYKPPFIKLGIIISCVSTLLYILIVIKERRKTIVK